VGLTLLSSPSTTSRERNAGSRACQNGSADRHTRSPSRKTQQLLPWPAPTRARKRPRQPGFRSKQMKSSTLLKAPRWRRAGLRWGHWGRWWKPRSSRWVP